MLVTHFGHAAVLVEAQGTRILIDPGQFSTEWHGLRDLDAVLVTHQHLDHIDPVGATALVEANPGAGVWIEPGVRNTLDLPMMREVRAGQTFTIGALTIRTHGGRHACIHADIPGIGNIGYEVTGPGEPTFFHPGDSLDAIPAGVDVLAVPLYGPWAAMKETIDFVRAVGAPHGFPIHEGLLNERGWNLIFGRVRELTKTTPHDLRQRTLAAEGGSVTIRES